MYKSQYYNIYIYIDEDEPLVSKVLKVYILKNINVMYYNTLCFFVNEILQFKFVLLSTPF